MKNDTSSKKQALSVGQKADSGYFSYFSGQGCFLYKQAS